MNLKIRQIFILMKFNSVFTKNPLSKAAFYCAFSYFVLCRFQVYGTLSTALTVYGREELKINIPAVQLLQFMLFSFVLNDSTQKYDKNVLRTYAHSTYQSSKLWSEVIVLCSASFL